MSTPGNNAPPTLDFAAMDIETVKELHQYYRDCLSTSLHFPDIGAFPPELIEWATDRRNTDVVQLAEYLQNIGDSNLPPEQDMALRLMLFTVLHANLACDFSNRYPGYTLPTHVAADIKRGLSRVLSLHPVHEYVAMSVQLLYRIKEIDEVLVLAESYPDIFAQFGQLKAIAGFIHTMLGDYDTGTHYLAPLAADPDLRQIPLVGLSLMTCEHFRGLTPQWPVSWDGLHADTSDVARLVDRLPSLQMVQPLAATPRPVVFAACDTKYFFQHAVHLAYSLHHSNVGKLDLHLHLYSPSPAVLAEIEALRKRLPGMSIGVSAEYDPVPGSRNSTYFATARFVRAYQIQALYQCDLCLTDADALFNGDWNAFVAGLPPQTELVLARSQTSPFWERVLAGFVYCRHTPLAEQFLAKVAHFILHNMALERLVWFTDQIALSACDDVFVLGNPAVHHIDSRTVIDLQHTPDSLCWMVTTIKTGNLLYDAARARLHAHYAARPALPPLGR
jgi:hypothetical protein